MKKILLFATALCIGNMMIAQKIATDNVPVEVSSTFKNKYSGAEKPSWQMDYDNYQVDFTFLKNQVSALFDKDGLWVESHTYITSADLPKEVRDSLAKQFGVILSTYTIEEAQKVESPSQDLYYQLTIVQGITTYDLVVAENGKMLKKEKRTEEHDGKIKLKKTKEKK